MHELYKLQAKASADAQEHRGSSPSSRLLTMSPHLDTTTTPVAWRNMLEVFKVFYPQAVPYLEFFAQFMERFLMRASARAFFILEFNLRKQFIEEGTAFSPLQPDIVMDMIFLLQAYQRPAQDFNAIIFSNCGGYHRAEECPKFALVFTPVPAATAPARSRQKRDRDPSASRSKSRSRSASSFRQSASRGRSKDRPRAEKRKSAPAVAFAPSTTESRLCISFKKDGKCRYGDDCKFKH